MTPSRFEYISTPLSGLTVIQRRPTEDERGFFCRFYCAEEFREAGLRKPIVQINHTFTKKRGAVRGLHFQYPPHAEVKIVSCLKGEIYDVAVDIRKNSPTFLQWFGTLLSRENKKSLLVSEGFAHGFQTVTEDTEIIYLVTAAYNQEKEGALSSKDPMIGIEWPLAITELSDKDKAIKYISHDYKGIVV